MINSFTIPKYIPELDGFRALAVISVILFHLRVPGFNLGWAGVNFFFVISGFLITRILLEAKTNPNYFRNFYIRRVIRIFPIYYLSLSFIIIGSLVFNWNIRDLFYYITYLQNYLLGLKNWSASFPDFFNHTWSLAVEEQFYIIWPLIIYVLNIKKLKVVSLLLFAFGIISRIILFYSTHNPNLQFTPLPTQVDALSAGGFLAVIIREKKYIPKIISWSPIILIISSIALFVLILHTGYSAYWSPSGWATSRLNLVLLSLLAIFFASLISYSIFSNTVFSSFLRLNWLGEIGKISYGIYLYHFPVFLAIDFALTKLGEHQTNFLCNFFSILVKVGLTYVFAKMSWKWFESPILTLKESFVL